MTELQRIALDSMRTSLALFRAAGLAMVPAIGGVTVMVRRGQRRWDRGETLRLPGIPEPMAMPQDAAR